MDRYKFRGKRLDNGEWVYGFGVHIFQGDKVEAELYSTYGSYDVDSATVGQYTGVKNNQDQEICESDIVKGKRWVRGESKRHIGIVHYVMGKYIVRGVGKYVGIDEELNPLYVVISNIHDNPELLEGKG